MSGEPEQPDFTPDNLRAVAIAVVQNAVLHGGVFVHVNVMHNSGASLRFNPDIVKEGYIDIVCQRSPLWDNNLVIEKARHLKLRTAISGIVLAISHSDITDDQLVPQHSAAHLKKCLRFVVGRTQESDKVRRLMLDMWKLAVQNTTMPSFVGLSHAEGTKKYLCSISVHVPSFKEYLHDWLEKHAKMDMSRWGAVKPWIHAIQSLWNQREPERAKGKHFDAGAEAKAAATAADLTAVNPDVIQMLRDPRIVKVASDGVNASLTVGSVAHFIGADSSFIGGKDFPFGGRRKPYASRSRRRKTSSKRRHRSRGSASLRRRRRSGGR